MSDRSPLLLGRHLLDRRGFLAHLATGMGGIALSALLAQDGLLAADNDAAPTRHARSGRPSAGQSARAQAAAFRRPGRSGFCTSSAPARSAISIPGTTSPSSGSGTASRCPGVEKLITFQGENGNLAQSPWKFKPRGQTGKYISDLLPHLAECADDLCFIHSLTSKTNTHGPGEMFMSTGFTLEGFPSIGAWVSYALGTENQDLPAYVAIPDPRGDPQQGPANWANGFLPAVYQGTAFNAEPADQPPRAAAGDRARRRPGRPRLSPLAQRRAPETAPRRHRAFGPDRRLRAGRPDATERPGGRRPVAREPGDAGPVRPRRSQSRSRPRSAATACSPAGCWSAGVRFVTLFNGAFAMGEGVLNWDGHRRIQSDYNRHGPILDQPAAALLVDLKARGLLDDTLVVWTTEFGRMPTFQKGTRAATITPRASPPGSPAPASSTGSASVPPTSSATRPSKTWSTFTTSTRPSCTCSASTTNGSLTTTTAHRGGSRMFTAT